MASRDDQPQLFVPASVVYCDDDVAVKWEKWEELVGWVGGWTREKRERGENQHQTAHSLGLYAACPPSS